VETKSWLERLPWVKIGLAVLFFVIYTVLTSWKFALLIMWGIGVHENGHLWAMRRYGMPTKGFFFLPFLGGVALGTGTLSSRWKHFVMVIMGPIWGLLSAVPSVIAYLISGNLYFAAGAIFICFFNLFNLVPMSILDGGQMTSSIAFSFNKTVGLVVIGAGVALAALILPRFNFLIAILVIWTGINQFMNEYSLRHKPDSMHKMDARYKTYAILSYLGLAALFYFSISAIAAWSHIGTLKQVFTILLK